MNASVSKRQRIEIELVDLFHGVVLTSFLDLLDLQSVCALRIVCKSLRATLKDLFSEARDLVLVYRKHRDSKQTKQVAALLPLPKFEFVSQLLLSECADQVLVSAAAKGDLVLIERALILAHDVVRAIAEAHYHRQDAAVQLLSANVVWVEGPRYDWVARWIKHLRCPRKSDLLVDPHCLPPCARCGKIVDTWYWHDDPITPLDFEAALDTVCDRCSAMGRLACIRCIDAAEGRRRSESHDSASSRSDDHDPSGDSDESDDEAGCAICGRARD